MNLETFSWYRKMVLIILHATATFDFFRYIFSDI